MSLLALDLLVRDATAHVLSRGSTGAGVFVARGILLTCAHVVGEADHVSIVWERTGQEAIRYDGHVELRLVDGPNPLGLAYGYPDIAVVQFDPDGNWHPCVMLGVARLEPGATCQAYGYPREGDAAGRTPVLLRYRGQKLAGATPFMDFGADRIRFGMSGGPVFDLAAGRVIGILVASKSQEGPDGGLAVPWWELRGLLPDVAAANEGFHLGDNTWSAAAAEDRKPPSIRHSRVVHGLDFDASGDRLATASSDRTAKVWDSRTGDELAAFRHPSVLGMPRPRIYSVAFSPDGKRLATASRDARIWSIGSGRELGHVSHASSLGRAGTRLPDLPPLGEAITMTKVSFSPSGSFLATATAESVRIWLVGTGEMWLKIEHSFVNVGALQGFHAPYIMAFSGDGRRLAVVCGPVLTVWEVETKQKIAEFRSSSSLNWFRAVAVSKSAERVFTGGSTLAVWDVTSGEMVTQMQAGSKVTSVACTPEGDHLLVAEQSGVIRVLLPDGWVELERSQYPRVPHSEVMLSKVTYAMNAVSFGPCVTIDSLGRLGAIGCGDGSVHIVNLLSVFSRREGEHGTRQTDNED
jgi:WD40 repeat protein